MGHFQLQFAVLPPLIIHALLRIATGRGSALWTGVRLGLLTAAQLFIGEELLVDTGRGRRDRGGGARPRSAARSH